MTCRTASRRESLHLNERKPDERKLLRSSEHNPKECYPNGHYPNERKLLHPNGHEPLHPGERNLNKRNLSERYPNEHHLNEHHPNEQHLKDETQLADGARGKGAACR